VGVGFLRLPPAPPRPGVKTPLGGLFAPPPPESSSSSEASSSSSPPSPPSPLPPSPSFPLPPLPAPPFLRQNRQLPLRLPDASRFEEVRKFILKNKKE
jgi:hypothetical protein